SLLARCVEAYRICLPSGKKYALVVLTFPVLTSFDSNFSPAAVGILPIHIWSQARPSFEFVFKR
ncbi:MAG: hypothetical protein H7320_10000, partial [Ferruginibacter sp.]|nr:hypothetical protein [Ferruginibacter sp.]